jgi:hypothetical protein
MSAEEVSNIIIDFLNHKNTITGDSKQLNIFNDV